jgi:hypothetical protein
MDAPVRCSDYSRQADELLIGTAVQTSAYLLIEYTGAWGEKALEESTIPLAVKDHLKALGRSLPGLKTLLVRSPRPALTPGVSVFVASALGGG